MTKAVSWSFSVRRSATNCRRALKWRAFDSSLCSKCGRRSLSNTTVPSQSGITAGSAAVAWSRASVATGGGGGGGGGNSCGGEGNGGDGSGGGDGGGDGGGVGIVGVESKACGDAGRGRVDGNRGGGGESGKLGRLLCFEGCGDSGIAIPILVESY